MAENFIPILLCDSLQEEAEASSESDFFQSVIAVTTALYVFSSTVCVIKMNETLFKDSYTLFITF